MYSFHESNLHDIFFDNFGTRSLIKSIENLTGGCIHNVLRIETSSESYCVKINSADHFAMLQAEAKDLEWLASTKTIRIPKVLNCNMYEGKISYLLLEYIIPGERSSSYWESLGESLAQLHQQSQTEFGLPYDNFIGSLSQSNTSQSSWSDFYINNRLEPQLNLGLSRGNLDFTFEKKLHSLYAKLPSLIIEENPSLIHGDLWSGNLLVDETGEPVLIDPSIYYGNREIEIAFTKLFGGFSKEFYDSYNAVFPLMKDFEKRMEIYLLYPLLVHCNLFGGGYKRQAESIIDKFI